MAAADGFSILEALIVVTIVAIGLALGVPAYTNLRLDLARSHEVQAWLQSIHLARAEALKRNAVVSICPSADGASCATPPGDWATGRIVFANLSVEQPPARGEDEPLVRAYGPWSTGQISANRESLSFRPFGQAGVTATIVFCDVRGPRSARALIISQAGRPRVADTRSSGEPLACD
jgi:type IV fimbrial biogenesis protein FimT